MAEAAPSQKMGIGVLLNKPVHSAAVVDRASVPGYAECEFRRTCAETAIAAQNYTRAVQLLQQNLDWCKAWLSNDPVDEMIIWHQEELARVLIKLNMYREAFQHLKDAYAVRTAVEPEAERTFDTMRDYAFVATKTGKSATAARVYNKLLCAQTGKYGSLDPRTRATNAELDKLSAQVANSLQLSKPVSSIQGTPSFINTLNTAGDGRRASPSISALNTAATAPPPYKPLHEIFGPVSTSEVLALKGADEMKASSAPPANPSAGLRAGPNLQGAGSTASPLPELEYKWLKPHTATARAGAGEGCNVAGFFSASVTTPKATTTTPATTSAASITKPKRKFVSRGQPAVYSESMGSEFIKSWTSLGDSAIIQAESSERKTPERTKTALLAKAIESTSATSAPTGAVADSISVFKLEDRMQTRNVPFLRGLLLQARAAQDSASTKPPSPAPNSLLPPNPVRRHARSKSDTMTRTKKISRSVSRDRLRDRVCDGTLAAAEDADSGVDEWFSFIEDINENILAEFRRQNGRRVRVAVLDTGVDMRNAVFSDREVRRRIKARVDFLDPEGFGLDTCGHGTHCVSLVNRVAPAADIYVGRVACDFDSGVDEEVVAKAIRKALGPKDVDGNWDVDVLSLSFGFPRLSEAIKAALDETHRPDKLILAAASNHGTRRGVAYPASRTGIITIHAADADGRPCNFNPSADPGNSLSILGKNVEAAWTCHGDPTNPASVRRMTGTSVATPIAAGVVSLLLEMTMLDVPGDPATEATLRQMHPMLKTYDGMMAVLTDMTARTQGYHNIVPWNVLDSTKTVANIAKYLREWVLNRRFGM